MGIVLLPLSGRYLAAPPSAGSLIEGVDVESSGTEIAFRSSGRSSQGYPEKSRKLRKSRKSRCVCVCVGVLGGVSAES